MAVALGIRRFLMMASQRYNIGDLVFAKLKGYSAWPGVIINIVQKTAPKKKVVILYKVLFFGARNHSLIKSKDIYLFDKSSILIKNKSPGFLAALREMEEYKKGNINLNFSDVVSETSVCLEDRLIDEVFESLSKKKYNSIFSLNHIEVPLNNPSQDMINLHNLLSALRKLENDKGDENNCFTHQDELHNVYTESTHAFKDYIISSKENLEMKRKISEVTKENSLISLEGINWSPIVLVKRLKK